MNGEPPISIVVWRGLLPGISEALGLEVELTPSISHMPPGTLLLDSSGEAILEIKEHWKGYAKMKQLSPPEEAGSYHLLSHGWFYHLAEPGPEATVVLERYQAMIRRNHYPKKEAKVKEEPKEEVPPFIADPEEYPTYVKAGETPGYEHYEVYHLPSRTILENVVEANLETGEIVRYTPLAKNGETEKISLGKGNIKIRRIKAV